MEPLEIDLRIEELVLHGVASRERFLVATELQRELTRLLAERGLPQAWQRGADVAQIVGGQPIAQAGAAQLGRQLAQRLYESFSQDRQATMPQASVASANSAANSAATPETSADAMPGSVDGKSVSEL